MWPRRCLSQESIVALEQSGSLGDDVHRSGDKTFSWRMPYPGATGFGLLVGSQRRGTMAESSPLLAISAQLKYIVDDVKRYIINLSRLPLIPSQHHPFFRCQQVPKSDLKCGVMGDSTLAAVLRPEIEICPRNETT